ncbi:hypothetical protein KFL_001820210 [Klebsormidium nitens]|uniref:C-terminal of Roc (COR) domain-containing protein n=1 Tax=Klebsormidium nitens TaxID=105231 RepID=A0A1Y1I835_KLENI|nr:hypothetical protein KFL_001820210 [Klebsormidium nitens]|eukprot:GAQ84268.1 hypothetical protein KFL_001820210 [Klebsormidium nitens]
MELEGINNLPASAGKRQESEAVFLLLKVCRREELEGDERPRLNQLLSNLATLNLASNRIDKEGAKILATELERATMLKTLDLRWTVISDSGIGALASKLGELVTLTALNLGFNEISSGGARRLGPQLCKLVKLTSLDLGHNRIEAAGARVLASALGALSCLTNLDLGHNRMEAGGIQALAPVLSKMTRLESLNLGVNNMGEKGAPWLASILSGMAGGALNHLALGHNFLEAGGAVVLAPVLGRLSRLTYLDVGGNFRMEFGTAAVFWGPELQKLELLTTLNLENNVIDDKGASVLAVFLRKMVGLANLNLQGNRIGDEGVQSLASTLGGMSGLTAVDLSNNQVHNLPLNLLRAPALCTLLCKGNRNLQSPPLPVALQGVQAMLEWLEDVESSGLEKKALAKLVFIGLPRAGKTSLFKALSKQDVSLGEATTVGGNLGFIEWKVADEKETVTFRAFDWAGQKQYGAMQRLFFTKEHCLYLLVVDISKDPEDDLDEINARVDLVQAVAPGATFILVGTKGDLIDRLIALRRLELVRSKIQEALDTEVRRVAEAFDVDNLDRYLGQPAPLLLEELFVVSSIGTSQQGRDPSLRALEGHIAAIVTNDPVNFKVGLPKSWVALMGAILGVQKQLEQSDSSSTVVARRVISMEEFNARFRSQEDSASAGALRYLTEVGYVLHFEKLDGLRGKVFLDPAWLVGECLGTLFDHTLADRYKSHPNAKVSDAAIQLCERGVLETFLIPELLGESGICTRAPPKDGHWWQGGVLTNLNGVSINIQRRNPGDPNGFSHFDILGSKPVQNDGDSQNTNTEIWAVIDRVVLKAIKVHRDLFGGDQLIHYSAACPEHLGCFVPLPYSILSEILKPGAMGVVRSGFSDCPSGDHTEVPWEQIAPDPGPLSNAQTLETLIGIASSVDDMARAQRAFPKLLDNATQFLAKLVEDVADTVVEVSTARTPRAFAISPGFSRTDPLKDMSHVLETVATETQALEAEVNEGLVQAAQKYLLIGYHFLSRELFQHTAIMYLLCENCFRVPVGHKGYTIHRNTQWGNRLASALTILIALGKIANVVGNVVGAREAVAPFVKVVELLKKPLTTEEGLPSTVRDLTAQMQHFSEKGLDSVELTGFLEEHDKGSEWRKFLFLERNRGREPGRPAVLWVCASCQRPRKSLDHPGDKGAKDGSPPGGQGCWARLTSCCTAGSSP